MSAVGFLNSCLDLFSSVLTAILAEPVLCFFASFILLASVFALFGAMVRGCRKI